MLWVGQSRAAGAGAGTEPGPARPVADIVAGAMTRAWLRAAARSLAAAAVIDRSLPNADSRGRYFIPQSGASTS